MHLRLCEKVKIGNMPIEGGLQIELRSFYIEST